MRNTHLKIDLGALRENARLIAGSLESGSALIACVKADAYGHGLIKASEAFLSGGASMLAVAIPEEGEQLREHFEADILVLGSCDERSAGISVSRRLIQTVHSIESLRALNAAAKSLHKTARAHIKIESGMNRLGVRHGEELEALLKESKICSSVKIEGVFTHFAKAAGDAPYTTRQNNRFLKAVMQAKETLGGCIAVHAANSAAALHYPSLHYDYVRCGIALYGCPPCRTKLPLKPALSWHTNVTQVHAVKAGETVGYERTFRAEKEIQVATAPVGYGDGYGRMTGNRGYALVNGCCAPVIGRVCMDQSMLDVTGIPVKPGDPVVLLGRQGRAEISADALAGWNDTISYEVLLRPTSRVPKVYLD